MHKESIKQFFDQRTTHRLHEKRCSKYYSFFYIVSVSPLSQGYMQICDIQYKIFHEQYGQVAQNFGYVNVFSKYKYCAKFLPNSENFAQGE